MTLRATITLSISRCTIVYSLKLLGILIGYTMLLKQSPSPVRDAFLYKVFDYLKVIYCNTIETLKKTQNQLRSV